jgi:hypothetical protein
MERVVGDCNFICYEVVDSRYSAVGNGEFLPSLTDDKPLGQFFQGVIQHHHHSVNESDRKTGRDIVILEH